MSDPALNPDDLVALDQEIIEFTQQTNLSPRESEVFRLLLSGVTTAEQMGRILKISPHTVNNHLQNIFDKTRTPNKTEVVALFVRRLLEHLKHARMFMRQPRVLVVDDEPDIVETIRAYLTQRGVKVLPYTDSMAALAAVAEQPLDFVISDIDMPKLDGLSLLSEIRRMHRFSPMMIFITGKPIYSLEKTLDLGAVAFVEKPVSMSKLFFTVMEHFIEGRYERSRLLRVDAKIPTVINSTLQLTITNIGFGGAFLPFGKKGAGQAELRVGEILDFSFRIEGIGPEIKARGEIVWRRDRAELGIEAGVGVKFVDLDDAGRHALEEFVRLNKVISFIPLGRGPAESA